GVGSRWRVARSHNDTVPPVPSLLPAARVLPSGLNATDVTGPPGPLMTGVPIGRWVAGSHNRTPPSSLPAARVLPSRLKATELTLVGPVVSGPPVGRGGAGPDKRALPSLLPAAVGSAPRVA